MNTPLPPDHDDDLPGEAELAALYRKLPKSEPGPALDAAVLRAAAEALAPGNDDSRTVANRQARTSRTRWLISLSSAATLVLAAGLAWHMRGMPVADSSMSQTASTRIAVPASAPSLAATPVAPLSVAAPAPASPQVAAAPNEMLFGNVTQLAPRMQIPQRLVPPPSVMKAKKLVVDKEAVADTMADITVAQSTGGNTAAPEPPPEPSQNYASYGAMSSPPPPVAEMNFASANKVAIADNKAENSRAAPAAMAAPLPMAAPAPAMPTAPDMTKKDHRDTPAQELDKIRLLFAAHRDDEAKARLQAFQHEHADQALPADLRARLSSRP
jgi:hypothetical protein